MENLKNKRVLQFGIDIMVKDEVNISLIEKTIVNLLNNEDFKVLGCMFSDDLTELYQRQYKELLNDN